jgi:hypothetical protein
LKGAEVVVEIELLPVSEINVHEMNVMTKEILANPIEVEQQSQEEWQGVTHRFSLASELAETHFETLNLAVVTDDFDANRFAENVDTEQHVKEDDEIARSESDEGNVQPSVNTAPDASVDTGGKGNEANVPSSVITVCDVPTSNHIDWSSYYTDEELRALKLKHINLKDYLNHKDICHIRSVVCGSAVVDDEGDPSVREEVIKKGQLFESLDAVKPFFKTTLYVTIDHNMWPSQTKTLSTS